MFGWFVEALSWMILGIFVIVVAYGIIRGGSFAYFRTRLEYRKAVKKEIAKEKVDGV